MRCELILNPRRVGLVLGLIALYLAVQSIVAEMVIDRVPENAGNRPILLTIDLFSVNAEATIPTWYSTIMLFCASVLLAVIVYSKRVAQERDTRYWIGLALIFFYLSMDEGAVIHEIVADAIQNGLRPTGFFTFGWQIVAAPIMIVVGLLYVRFLRRLPARTRNLVILAGALYVGGAFVIEGVSANQWYIDRGSTIEYLAIATVEELCEMLGVVIFICALLDYSMWAEYQFVFRSPTSIHNEARPPEDKSMEARAAKRVPLFSHLLIAVLVVILVLNGSIFVWAASQPAQAAPEVRRSSASTEAIIDLILTDDVHVTRMAGRFDLSNSASLRMAEALLNAFDSVMIVTSAQGSFALAADTLPFDRTRLANVLSANGEGQFAIFDTAAVRAIVASSS